MRFTCYVLFANRYIVKKRWYQPLQWLTGQCIAQFRSYWTIWNIFLLKFWKIPFRSSQMGTPFKCWILLCLTATLAFANYTDYSHLKLPPSGSWYLEEFGKLRPGKADKYTGCMCPSTLNTTGSTYMFCGHEMFPKVGGTCQPEGGYRCVNGQAEAIMELDCADESSVRGNVLKSAYLYVVSRFLPLCIIPFA